MPAEQERMTAFLIWHFPNHIFLVLMEFVVKAKNEA